MCGVVAAVMGEEKEISQARVHAFIVIVILLLWQVVTILVNKSQQ